MNNLKSTWPTKFSVPFWGSLDNLLTDACIIFRESVDNFEITHKRAYFKVGVQYPLKGLKKKNTKDTP